MPYFTAMEVEVFDLLLIGSNALIILTTVILSYFTAKAAEDTARSVHNDDNRVIRALIRENKNARHSRGRSKV